jgi:hypothetical protein
MSDAGRHDANRSRVPFTFAFAGLSTGIACAFILYFFAGPKTYPAVLGFRQIWNFALMPILASILSSGIAYAVMRYVRSISVGVLFGVLVSALSFIAFIVIFSAYVAGRNFLEVLPGFLVFGALLLGWLVLGIGGLTGHLASRKAR